MQSTIELNIKGLRKALNYKIFDMTEEWKKDKASFEKTYQMIKDIKETLEQEETEATPEQAKTIAVSFVVFCWGYHIYQSRSPELFKEIQRLLTFAMQQAKASKDEQAYFIVKYVNASVLRGYGENQPAITIMKQAMLKLGEGPSLARAHALNNYALVVLRANDANAKKAKTLFEEAEKLDLKKPSKNPEADEVIGTAEGDFIARTQMNLSQVYTRLELYPKAVIAAEKALEAKQKIGAPAMDIAYTQIVYTEALMKTGQYDKSKGPIKQSVETYQRFYNAKPNDNFMRALICFSEVAHQLKNTNEATAHASDAYTMAVQLGYKPRHELVDRIRDLNLLDLASVPEPEGAVSSL